MCAYHAFGPQASGRTHDKHTSYDAYGAQEVHFTSITYSANRQRRDVVRIHHKTDPPVPCPFGGDPQQRRVLAGARETPGEHSMTKTDGSQKHEQLNMSRSPGASASPACFKESCEGCVCVCVWEGGGWGGGLGGLRSEPLCLQRLLSLC